MTDFKNDKVWLMQGDCLERMKEIPDGSVDMVLCDPPYQITDNKWDSIISLDAMWKELYRITKVDAPIVIFSAQPFTSILITSNLKHYKYNWLWEKSQAVGHLNAWRQPMRNTEDVCVFYRKAVKYNPILEDKPLVNQRPQTVRTQTSSNYGNHKLDVHKCPPDKTMPKTTLKFNNAQGTIHPTQKPVDLLEYLVKTYTNEGETVLDFTMGSGSTIKAALNTNRKAIGIELGQCEKKKSEYFGVDWTDVLISQLDLKGNIYEN